MPTNEWFQENPKISAYVSKELHQKLESWMEEKGVKKVSQAITLILEDYLKVDYKVDQINLNQVEFYLQRLELLEGKVDTLSQAVEVLREGNLNKLSKPKLDQSRAKEVSFKKTVDETKWLTTREAYDLYGEGISQNTFRKLRPEDLRKRFNLESDLARRVHGKNDSRWLRKIDPSQPETTL